MADPTAQTCDGCAAEEGILGGVGAAASERAIEPKATPFGEGPLLASSSESRLSAPGLLERSAAVEFIAEDVILAEVRVMPTWLQQRPGLSCFPAGR